MGRRLTEHAEVDVVVLGMGPGGEHAAIKLARAGLDVVAVEDRLVGGECPYYGCVPSKMMIAASGALAAARRVADLAGTAEVHPGLGPGRRPDPGRGHRRLGRPRRGRSGSRSPARPSSAGAAASTAPVACGSATRRTSRRAASSSTPGPPRRCRPSTGSPGRRTGPTATSSRVSELPASMVVIGGGPIGCELAQAFARFGVEVTVVEVADRLIAGEEPEAGAAAREAVRRRGDRGPHRSGDRLGRPRRGSVHRDGGGGADRRRQAAGRGRPHRQPRRHRAGDRSGSTRRPGSWRPTSGCVPARSCGRSATSPARVRSPTSRCTRARSSSATLLGEDGPPADYRAVTRVTFTGPEVAAVGQTEQQARDAGVDVATGTRRPRRAGLAGPAGGPGQAGRRRATGASWSARRSSARRPGR